jgi:hypothetical protein
MPVNPKKKEIKVGEIIHFRDVVEPVDKLEQEPKEKITKKKKK